MPKPIGLYIHVPFCQTLCPYCDFYSLTGQNQAVLDEYTNAVISSLKQWHRQLDGMTADTLYFGGGTPSLLGGERISRITQTATSCFGLKNAEITMEANPSDELDGVFTAFAEVGGNRVSLGMQTADENQLAFLGRRHRPQDVEAAVTAAGKAGIDNISLDLMLGLEDQSVKSIVSSAAHAFNLGATHISAYLLKIEEGTPFYNQKGTMSLPDEDSTAEIYLEACQAIEMLGYRQYEISNFAKPGFESRHNLKYWNADPYLGIGPAAHSFIKGRRFYYPRDLKAFIKGIKPLPERDIEDSSEPDLIREAGEQEYIMLRLRLVEGITHKGFLRHFGHPIPAIVFERAARLPQTLVTADCNGIRLSKQGFLLSNTIIGKLINK